MRSPPPGLPLCTILFLLRVFLHHARVFPNSNLTMVFCCFLFYSVLHSVISSAQERASIYFTARNYIELSCDFDKVYCPIAIEIVSNDVASWPQLQITAVCSSDHFKPAQSRCLNATCYAGTLTAACQVKSLLSIHHSHNFQSTTWVDPNVATSQTADCWSHGVQV